ncbi:MAG TPA: 5'-nucleotidase C-terminal domain-containing protein, partial [bacterium]|nr:5'-nucleotidase C-terminal domain-containing protein [bacterium]
SSSYRRLPNVGIRTGEEPMMNLITDAMLYFGRKNFNGAKSSSGTKDDGFKKIRIAAHNGGGIWKTYPDSYPVTNFNVGQSAKNIKDFIRFDNHLAVVEFTPQTLKNLIEYSLGGMKYRNGDATTTTAGGVSDGNFIHWSGLSFTYDRGASSAANNAFYYNSSAATVDNQGARVRDLYLFNVPEYDAINDQYDTALRDALNNPQDSIAVVLNGSVVPAQANTKIYGVIVDFLALTELAAQAAMDISGLGDEKLLYIDAINRPNEAIDAVVSNSNYTLYHRLQGRIRAVE